MRIYKTLVIVSLFLSTQLASQDFPGYNTGNYNGVNGAFLNPANIADSRYSWDVNLFALHTYVGNNQASFNLKNIGQTVGDSLLNQFIGKNAGLTRALINLGVHGPSLMINTSKKSAVALTTRARIMINANDIDAPLVNQITDGSSGDISFPYSINSNANMGLGINGWTEYGLSYASVITDKDKHFFKGGLTLKYLAGAANGYLNMKSLKGTMDYDDVKEETYLHNSTGKMQLGFGGVNLDDFEAGQLLAFKSTGIGADIGFVYEFRPDYAKYRLDDNSWRKDLNKYKLRIGVALLDIGSIKYEKDMQRSGAYNMDITGMEKWYLNEMSEVEIDEIKNYFDTNPQYFIPESGNTEKKYKVALPSSLRIDADYHFNKGIYINVAGQISLVNTANKAWNSYYYSSLTITPRIEGRKLGLYIPVNYNQLTKLNAGVSARLGPLFIGSGSALTALFGNSKQVDFHVGVRFGGLRKNMLKKQERQKEKKVGKENN
ncbi:DUF5723 family protein [Agriterribacter sp.]|uniref:DUF5723 family protein n=1 Tax=Agriterribacter sp. TaxID=2821509 RepID=UPI002BAB760A|nr:DUF5723 family protein [Agriterribacter sp.]HTN08183.1 DUF5723 family protein [Agriterribacter sp.]